MDESNIEILKDDIFTKEVKYDKNQEEKTFAQNMKTTKNKEQVFANFCEITLHKFEED